MRAFLKLLPIAALMVGAVRPAFPGPAASVSPTARTANAGPQESRIEWKKKYLAAIKIGAMAEVKRLIKRDQAHAIYWVVETGKAISARTNDKLETEMAALRKGWKLAMETEFANNVYTYFSLMDGVQRQQRGQLDARYSTARSRYLRNLKDKKPEVFDVLFRELGAIAKQYHDVGDHYWSSTCWVLAYNCVNELNLGDKADLYRAYQSMKEAVAERLHVDLKDTVYNECKGTVGVLKNLGYGGDSDSPEGDPGPGGGPGPPASGPSKEKAAVLATAKFEMFNGIGSITRPIYLNDEIHGLWQTVYLKGKGTSAIIGSLRDLSPRVLRVGSSEVWLDLDGDNKGDVPVPLRGKIDPLQFSLGQGDQKRDWGCLITTGTNADVYQGIQMNMNPDDTQMVLYLHAAASVVGKLEGVPFRVIDENMDGVYGSAPMEWGYDGLSGEYLQPNIDSIVIGGGKRALPWSEYQKFGDTWYRLEIQQNGLSWKAYPTEIKTGKIKLSFKGVKPSWLVVKGTGKYENSYFDLLQKGLELPVGNWTLFAGLVRKGKKIQTMKAFILPGPKTRHWTVMAGAVTKAQLGAPFRFDFKFDDEDGDLTVSGNSVVVIGKHDERYERAWNCVPRPAAAWRKVGDRKGSKPKKFKAVLDQDQLTAANSWAIAWFPMDLTLHKKGVKDKAEVQLTEKKNKLFGKVISDWKGE